MESKTRCHPYGTSHYWPAVECRPPDRSSARPPAMLQTTDDDGRCQRGKQYWPIRRDSNNQVKLRSYDDVLEKVEGVKR